ncbi:MerR family transcriptional regulator [Lapillicoccus jejuensis]|uniref:MerR family transcriptional regulator n=1 Tax=Lapillicoccus jejuensis TaxID=402171 RepID=UPI0011525B24|nr:MerR family transcriptional regulator [Lapillicoccus jejuensis]
MAWSTRQLADLAHTSVSTVRHYHKVGLLDVPERGLNGYKRYGVPHLVRLLRILRLADLGVPLARIAEWDREDTDLGHELDELDAELGSAMARMARAREELAVLRAHHSPVDVPPGFAPLARSLSPAQRGILLVLSAVLGPRDLDQLRDAMSVADPATDEFERLAPDADDATVERLARRMLGSARRSRRTHPALLDLTSRSPHGEQAAQDALARALVQYYHPAQLRTLQRLHALLEVGDPVAPAPTPPPEHGSSP